jgi:acetylornithine deacetylase
VTTSAAVDPVALTCALVDIDSTSGAEGEAGRWLSTYLRGLGYTVTEQPVEASRFNVLATLDKPEVVFSTHYDTVPPFFRSCVAQGRIYGRGSCDAKGVLAAQVAAVEQLRAEGERRVGLLFVVGEERGSEGAKVANAIPNRCRYLIDGEPTDLRLGVATRGVLRLRLLASGKAAHSALPELGESAIDKLLDVLIELRKMPLPDDPVLGRTHYTIGLIKGGVAPNVVSPAAEAEVLFRTVCDSRDVLDAVAGLGQRVTLEPLLDVPIVRLTTVPGFETAVCQFTTDIPFLTNWGRPLLYGPGSIHVAHTADESVAIDELHAAIDGNVRLARALLAQAS